MGNSPEKKMIQFSVKFASIRFLTITTLHDTIETVTNIFQSLNTS